MSFFIDPFAQTVTEMRFAQIVGKGPTITCEDNKAQDKINEFNSNINGYNQTIVDWLKENWYDNVISGNCLYVVKYYKGEPQLLRVPPETFIVEYHPYNAWRKFVQNAQVMDIYSTYNQFIKGEPTMNQTFGGKYRPIGIPDLPEVCTYTKLFKRPPMASASKFIVLKHIILYFIRKFGEKMWAPLLLARIGDPKSSQYPSTDEEMTSAMRQVVRMLVKTRQFGAAAVPGNTTVDIIEPKQNGAIYLDYINAMDEQVLYSLFATSSSKSGNSVYKGDEQSIENQTRFMQNIRSEFEQVLKRLWVSVVVPGYNPDDIKIEWPPLRSTNVADTASAFDIFARGGVFVDANERRDIASSIWPELRKRKLTPEEIKKLDDEFIQMVSPSQPGESTLDAVKNKSNLPKDQPKKNVDNKPNPAAIDK